MDVDKQNDLDTSSIEEAIKAQKKKKNACPVET